MTSVPMPKLGAGVYHEGVILKWKKGVGDAVNAGDPIADIETEKAISEYVSPASGVVLKLLFQEGETVEVGTPILLLGQPGESLRDAPLASAGTAAGPTTTAGAATTPGAGGQAGSPPRANELSPAARRLAENLKVDLSKVVGTGPGGSVMREDILKASRAQRSSSSSSSPVAAQQAQQHGAVSSVPSTPKLVQLSGMRSTIARRLVQSQHETASVTLTREVEVSRLATMVKGGGSQSPAQFGYNDVIIRAVAEALKRHPMMNSRLEQDGQNLRILETIDIGVAVAVEGGLITPTLMKADTLSVQQIAEAVKRLSEKARARQLTPEEYESATFTVSNLGAFGIDAFTPIINPPQVGILGVGRVADRPWVKDGILGISPTVTLSLTFDHRVVDGADAARFLDTISKLIQDVSWLGGT